jgi:hypothetical protein
LTAAEIREICAEDNHGETLPPPVDLRSRLPFRSGIINE